jgi:hypothetical protein
MKVDRKHVHDRRANTTVESVVQDIRFGLRQMRRNPAFTLTAVITLGLGIGATTAIFSAVYALLLRPLPYPGSDRLMFIYQHTKYDDMAALLNQDFFAAQPALKSFESVAGYLDNEDENLTGAGAPMRVLAMRVTANLFPTLRVTPALGRNFLCSEDRKGGPAVLILSHRLWQSRWNSDPAIIGRAIILAGKAQTVVGVLPAHFVFPNSAAEPDLYIPAAMDTDTSLATTNVSVWTVPAIARLREGVTLSQAQVELNLFEQNRVKGYGPFFVNWAEGRKILAQPLQRILTGDDREPLLILLACVAVVLLVACANVASLQLARTVAREPEMALRGALLVAEIGLAVLLLTGAGLLIRSFAHVLQNGAGFDPRQCLTAKVQRNPSEELEKTKAFAQQLLPRLKAIPGVQAAAIGSVLPLEHDYQGRTLAFGDGPPLPVGQRPGALSIGISPEYFRATGTSLLQGRTFTSADNAGTVPVAIVSQAFARKYLNGDALDKQFRINLHGHDIFTPVTAVGIVQDVHYDSLETDIQPVIYLPFDQVPYGEVNILLRSSIEPASLTTAIRKAVLDTDPMQPLFDVATMASRLSQSLAQRRLIMLLIAAFAMLAMILAGVGVYGAFSYWVSQRRQEMGIRLALGSSRSGLLRLIVMQSARLILAGGIVGIAGAWFLDRLLASMLVGVKVHDPVSLSLAWALMTLIALLGSSLPAAAAARTDIVSVLHSE